MTLVFWQSVEHGNLTAVLGIVQALTLFVLFDMRSRIMRLENRFFNKNGEKK